MVSCGFFLFLTPQPGRTRNQVEHEPSYHQHMGMERTKTWNSWERLGKPTGEEKLMMVDAQAPPMFVCQRVYILNART